MASRSDSGNNDRDDNENNVEVNQPPRTLRDFLNPARQTTPSCIAMTTIAGQYEIKPGVIQLLPKFHGLDSESAYLHLKEFEEVCATLQLQNMGPKIIKLRLFPFSMKDRAKAWLHSLRPNSISTWHGLVNEFLKKFFPQHKTNALKRDAMNFRQKEKESHFKCWERFDELILARPHHGFKIYRLIEIFIKGLTSDTRQFIEMMCSGQFDQKELDRAWEFLELMARNAQKWATSDRGDHSKVMNQSNSGVHQLNDQIAIQVNIAALTREVETLKLGRNKEIAMVCGICASESHMSADNPTVPALQEAIQEKNIEMPLGPNKKHKEKAGSFPLINKTNHDPPRGIPKNWKRQL